MKSRNQKNSYLTLDRRLTYQILVPGALDPDWLDWNGGLEILIGDDGQQRAVTVLTITTDQAGLHGLLKKIYTLGLPLISVRWLDYTGSLPELEEPSSEGGD